MSPSRILASAAARSPTKQLFIIRHGQALHNPRAEAARHAGCSHEEFLELMRQDDVLDADLTELGESQARQVGVQHDFQQVQLVVSSPLSRAIRTADLVAPNNGSKRVAVEHFREVNGWLLNAKRRHREDLEERFPSWDFTELAHEDELWTPSLESNLDCAQRGYEGLRWLMERPEEKILLVSHGGILRYVMNHHENVAVVDGRRLPNGRNDVLARFGNCEVRKYTISWKETDEDVNQIEGRRSIVLAETD